VGPVEAGDAFGPHRQQQLAAVTELVHLVVSGVGHPDVIPGVGVEAVGRSEHPVAPGGQNLAGGAVEAQDGTIAAVKHPDVIVRIHVHPGDLTEGEPLRQLRPAVNHFIKEAVSY